MSFDLSHFKTFYFEYCYKNHNSDNNNDKEYLMCETKQEFTDLNLYTFSLYQKQYCNLDIIKALSDNSYDQMKKILKKIAVLYIKPQDNNILKHKK